MNDWGRRVRHQQRIISALSGQHKVLEGCIPPDLRRCHRARDVLRESRVVGGFGSKLVERYNANSGDDGSSPEWSVKHLRRRYWVS